MYDALLRSDLPLLNYQKSDDYSLKYGEIYLKTVSLNRVYTVYCMMPLTSELPLHKHQKFLELFIFIIYFSIVVPLTRVFYPDENVAFTTKGLQKKNNLVGRRWKNK